MISSFLKYTQIEIYLALVFTMHVVIFIFMESVRLLNITRQIIVGHCFDIYNLIDHCKVKRRYDNRVWIYQRIGDNVWRYHKVMHYHCYIYYRTYRVDLGYRQQDKRILICSRLGRS